MFTPLPSPPAPLPTMAILPHFLIFLTLLHPYSTTTSLGINYGQLANNLPHPSTVLPLVKSLGITRVKLYDADPKVLKAFSNSNIEFIICIPNENLSTIRDPKNSLSWVKTNVQSYLPSTKITTIAVGNEILTLNDTALSSNLLPAMESVYSALLTLNLHKQVIVTTPHNLNILEVSYPPSAGTFRKDFVNKLNSILDFHNRVGSPFLVNSYPYFAYKANPKQVSLEYVLFESSNGMVDPGSGLKYDNMFYAQIDAAYAAVEKLGFKNVCLQIAETGWPSKGDEDEVGASPENARKYNGNLMKLVKEKKGTPMRPGQDLNVYLFALFNENQKPGPTSERNFGLFEPDGTPVYNLGFNVTGLVSGNVSSGSGGGLGAAAEPGSGSGPSSEGYLTISDDAGRLGFVGALSFFCLLVSVTLVAYQL